MKALKPFLGLFALMLVVAGGFMYVDSRSSLGPNGRVDSELSRSFSGISRLGSQSLTDTVSESDLEKLEHTFEVNENKKRISEERLEVLELDRKHFEEQIRKIFDGQVFDVEALLDELRQPSMYIARKADHKEQGRIILADRVGIRSEDLPVGDHVFWDHAYEVTKDTRAKKQDYRKISVVEDRRQNLCINTEDRVDMITFSKDNQGVISYSTTDSYKPYCDGPRSDLPTPGAYIEYSYRRVCEDNQLKLSEKATECMHGCAQDTGLCKEEEPIQITLSHFSLCKANEEIIASDDEPSTETSYQFDLGVIATNSDNSIATSYDGKGLIIITGDNDATYPEQTTLTLDGGVGYFPISLTKTQSTFGQPVTLSYKDATYYINGSESYRDLRECPEIDNDDNPGEGVTFDPAKEAQYIDIINRAAQSIRDQGYSFDILTFLDQFDDYELNVILSVLDGSLFETGQVGDYLNGSALLSQGLNQGTLDDAANNLNNAMDDAGLNPGDLSDDIKNNHQGDSDGDCQETGTCPLPGCTDSSANNYDPAATEDDGSCEYEEGCTDSEATNYNSSAVVDDGTCEYEDQCKLYRDEERFYIEQLSEMDENCDQLEEEADAAEEAHYQAEQAVEDAKQDLEDAKNSEYEPPAGDPFSDDPAPEPTQSELDAFEKQKQENIDAAEQALSDAEDAEFDAFNDMIEKQGLEETCRNGGEELVTNRNFYGELAGECENN